MVLPKHLKKQCVGAANCEYYVVNEPYNCKVAMVSLARELHRSIAVREVGNEQGS
jgi:hypothetical protein